MKGIEKANLNVPITKLPSPASRSEKDGTQGNLVNKDTSKIVYGGINSAESKDTKKSFLQRLSNSTEGLFSTPQIELQKLEIIKLEKMQKDATAGLAGELLDSDLELRRNMEGMQSLFGENTLMEAKENYSKILSKDNKTEEDKTEGAKALGIRILNGDVPEGKLDEEQQGVVDKALESPEQRLEYYKQIGLTKNYYKKIEAEIAKLKDKDSIKAAAGGFFTGLAAIGYELSSKEVQAYTLEMLVATAAATFIYKTSFDKNRPSPDAVKMMNKLEKVYSEFQEEENATVNFFMRRGGTKKPTRLVGFRQNTDIESLKPSSPWRRNPIDTFTPVPDNWPAGKEWGVFSEGVHNLFYLEDYIREYNNVILQYPNDDEAMIPSRKVPVRIARDEINLLKSFTYEINGIPMEETVNDKGMKAERFASRMGAYRARDELLSKLNIYLSDISTRQRMLSTSMTLGSPEEQFNTRLGGYEKVLKAYKEAVEFDIKNTGSFTEEDRGKIVKYSRNVGGSVALLTGNIFPGAITYLIMANTAAILGTKYLESQGNNRKNSSEYTKLTFERKDFFKRLATQTLVTVAIFSLTAFVFGNKQDDALRANTANILKSKPGDGWNIRNVGWGFDNNLDPLFFIKRTDWGALTLAMKGAGLEKDNQTAPKLAVPTTPVGNQEYIVDGGKDFLNSFNGLTPEKAKQVSQYGERFDEQNMAARIEQQAKSNSIRENIYPMLSAILSEGDPNKMPNKNQLTQILDDLGKLGDESKLPPNEAAIINDLKNKAKTWIQIENKLSAENLYEIYQNRKAANNSAQAIKNPQLQNAVKDFYDKLNNINPTLSIDDIIKIFSI